MNKLFLMLFSITLLASCSSDDDAANNNNDDRIYGKWFVEDANIPTFELNDCNKRSSIIFKGNFDTFAKYFESSSGECKVKDSTESTWSREDDIYTFQIPFPELENERLSGKIEFKNNGKQFVFSPSDFPRITLVFNREPQVDFEEK